MRLFQEIIPARLTNQQTDMRVHKEVEHINVDLQKERKNGTTMEIRSSKCLHCTYKHTGNVIMK